MNVGGVLITEAANGFIGGGQVGSNWQSRHAVFGLETDLSTPPGNPTVVTGRLDVLDTMWIVRAGVNYKFSG
jgi:opacity protein-like surface antigen